MPLLLDGDVTTGFVRERSFLLYLFGRKIPKPIFNYAKKISELTGLPLEQVIESQPVQNMIRSWQEYTTVRKST